LADISFALKRHIVMDEQNTEAGTNNWLIPLWVKAAVTFFAFSAGGIFILSLFSEQKTLFGLSAGLITAISLGLVLFFIPIVIAFWFFPHSAPVLFLYWLIWFFRVQICIFALLGVVYLITVRAGPFSLRGGIPAISLFLILVMTLFIQPLGSERYPLPWLERFFTLLKKFANRIYSVPTWILSTLAAFLPILIVCAIIYLGLDASLSDYRPYSAWNDETAYWLQIRSISHVGFNVGYSVPNEFVAPAAFNRYALGTPFYIYIYGSIARLTGWSPQLPILINFVILALAIFLFAYFTKLDSLQIVFTGLTAIVTWPILMYLPMTTHEPLNQAIGFMIAAVFFVLLTDRERVQPLTRVSFVLFVYLATLIRLSWGLLLIPVVFYSLNGKIFRRVFFAMLLGLGLYISATLITNYLVPPGINSIFLTLKDSLVHGPQILAKRIFDQFAQMFRYGTFNANIAIMFQIAIILGWNIIRLARMIKSKLSIASILESRTVFDIYNMGTLAFAGLTFYLQSGFHRTFAPPILLVCLLQAAKKDYKFLATLLVLNIALFFAYMGPGTGASRVMKDDFGAEFAESAALQATFEKWIVYDPTAQNPWCNTLLVPVSYYDRRLTVTPPGLGISYFSDDPSIIQSGTIKTPPKSKYLFFDKITYASLAADLNVKLLESSPLGDLYYNLDSGCNINQ
jgi:hypothetical protein